GRLACERLLPVEAQDLATRLRHGLVRRHAGPRGATARAGLRLPGLRAGLRWMWRRERVALHGGIGRPRLRGVQQRQRALELRERLRAQPEGLEPVRDGAKIGRVARWRQL